MDPNSTPPLRDAWYYALPSARLARGRILAKTMLGEPVLLGRDESGMAFALVDICPHRGIPLRYGKFDGKEVECCYHGWRFAPSGACTCIPSLTPEQQIETGKVKVRAYPVREIQGGIWLFFGTAPERAPEVPVMAGFDAARAPDLALTMLFEGGIDHAVIGLMDPSHGPFVHRSWFWRSGKVLKDKAKQFEPAPWGFTMTRHEPASNTRAYKILGGKPETEISFRLPGLRWEDIKVGPHRMAQLTTLTPIDDRRTEITQSVFWTMPWLTMLKPLLRPIARQFLGQDRDVMVRQMEGLAHQPQLLLLGDPDVQARWYMRLKAEFLRAQEEAREFVNPVKPRLLKWRS